MAPGYTNVVTPERHRGTKGRLRWPRNAAGLQYSRGRQRPRARAGRTALNAA